MMDADLPRTLAAFRGKGYVIAPAGHGKTHLIASAVKASRHRQLILTHTYAGVAALQKKMQSLGVPASRYQIDTLASWTLRLALYFPATSGWAEELPNGDEWGKLYATCGALVAKPFVVRLIKSSYDGFYVDEYQDCSAVQHNLVEALAKLLPCRILGDPLQAIFDFADAPVDWDAHIYPHYELLGELKKPWRWKLAGADELASWLATARDQLIAGETISVTGALPNGVRRVAVDLDDFKNPRRLDLFYKFLRQQGSVIAIQAGDQKSKSKTHQLARLLKGRFSSIEEVEGKDLFAFIKKLEGAKTAGQKLCTAIDFAKKCMTGIDGILSDATKRGEPAKITKATKCPEVIARANQYLAEPSCLNLGRLFKAFSSNPETAVFRRDLMNRFAKVLATHAESNGMTLLDSAKRYQRDFRHSGRPLRHDKLIATTLLVKGLEYDHAIVLGGDAMSPKELYVALTRGAKSVTIVTMKNEIPSQRIDELIDVGAEPLLA